jgi:Putative addiction module component
MTTAEIAQMSWEEKLRALEELWEAITREGDRYESPAWHEEALKESERGASSGSEQPIDWATAKRELRK